MKIMNRVKILKDDKIFLSRAVSIAVPIAIQGLLNTTLNLVDSLMIGSLGETTIAAVGLANKVFFVFTLLLFGICSGAGILTAQYWGQKDVKNIRRVLGMSVLLGVLASLLFLIPALINPKAVMRIFTPQTTTIAIGAAYLTVVAISYPLTAITNAYIALLRGINQVKAPVVISLISIVVNCGINYVLIFGKFGMPKLGVVGAAIGTLIARIVECSALLIIVYLQKGPAAAKLKELFHFDLSFVKKFFKSAAPVIANEFIWGVGVTMYALVYGRMGDSAVAAITITQTFEQVLTVVFQSISAATAVILGNELGANHLKRADEYAKNFIVLQFLLVFVMAFVCFISRWPIISMYSVSDAVAKQISMCFMMFIAYMPFKMFNYVNVVGILRSGGDTIAALVLDTTGVWFIGIPMAYIGGIVFGFPIYIVYGMVMIEEIYKFALGVRRYKKKKWLCNLITSQSA